MKPLALLLTALVTNAVLGADIPSHPRDLAFPTVHFIPPERSQYRHVLPSGVVVYVVENHELPLVDVGVLVRTGSYLEPAGKAGVASITGSQLRAGGTSRLAPADLDEELAFLAANMGSSIGDTEGGASMSCLTKDLPRALEIFFDMLRSPRFDPERLGLEKNQRIQELGRRNDQTSGIEAREWERLLRGADFFSNDRVTKASLESIVREDLLAFHQRAYHPKHFLFTVSGNVAASDILARLENHLKEWAREPCLLDPVPPVPQPTHSPRPKLYLVDKPSVNQGRVVIGHLAPLRTHPDNFALLAMNQILGGGGFSSRITSRVRSDEGLAYTAASRLELGIHYPGVFRAYFQSKSESVGKATKIVLEEIDRIRKEKVSSEDLAIAVNYAIGAFPRAFANPQSIASTLANDEFTGRHPDYWRTYRDKLKAVTPDDVLRVAQEHLHPDKLLLLVVGNIEEILKGGLTGGDVERVALPDPLTLAYPQN